MAMNGWMVFKCFGLISKNSRNQTDPKVALKNFFNIKSFPQVTIIAWDSNLGVRTSCRHSCDNTTRQFSHKSNLVSLKLLRLSSLMLIVSETTAWNLQNLWTFSLHHNHYRFAFHFSDFLSSFILFSIIISNWKISKLFSMAKHGRKSTRRHFCFIIFFPFIVDVDEKFLISSSFSL